jgi:predicted amino acid dehydrogenase
LNAIAQLVDNGTITATQGQAVDSELRQGNFDPSTLTGFTEAQIQAVEQALANAKRAQVPTGPGTSPDR